MIDFTIAVDHASSQQLQVSSYFSVWSHDVRVLIDEGIRKKTRNRTEETEKEYCVTLR